MKSTEIELKPDDPIFSEGYQRFVPAPRPSTPTLPRATDGTPLLNDSPEFANLADAGIQAHLDEFHAKKDLPPSDGSPTQ